MWRCLENDAANDPAYDAGHRPPPEPRRSRGPPETLPYHTRHVTFCQ